MMEAKISRNTKETRIELLLSNDKRERSLETGCGFLSHMLDLLCHRAALGVSIKARGDIEVDYHHLSEDIGIAMGQALRKIAGAAPIRRYGSALLPMDGSLARVALDFSGRGGLWWRGEFPSQRCGDFDMELVKEYIHMRNPQAEIFPVCAKTGEGMKEWILWLENKVLSIKKVNNNE